MEGYREVMVDVLPPDNGRGRLSARLEAAKTPRVFKVAARPFEWRDPQTIPPRRWLYGHHYIEKFLSATVAPGGLGKSSLALVEAVAMASGRALLGQKPRCPLTVWYYNGEDPLDEIERRVAAILLHYRIAPEEIEGRLFVNSGRDCPLIIVEKISDTITVHEPVVDGIIEEIRRVGVQVLILDPFVSTHGVPENDNGAIDRVAKTWSSVSEVTSVATDLVHHVRKQVSGQSEFTVEDARGAVSLIGAVRSARVLNVMTASEASQCGVSDDERRSFFRVDNGKANMRPPSTGAQWRRLTSVGLGNGTADDEEDWVGVVENWTMPGPFEGVTVDHLRAVQDAVAKGSWRDHEQSANWVGIAVAEVLELDVEDKGVRGKIKGDPSDLAQVRCPAPRGAQRRPPEDEDVHRGWGGCHVISSAAPPRKVWWRKVAQWSTAHLLHHPPCKKGGGVEHCWLRTGRWST